MSADDTTPNGAPHGPHPEASDAPNGAAGASKTNRVLTAEEFAEEFWRQQAVPSITVDSTVATFFRYEKSHPKPLTGAGGVLVDSSYEEKPISGALAAGHPSYLIAPYVSPLRRRMGRHPIAAGAALEMRLFLARVVDTEGDRDKYKQVVRARDDWWDSDIGQRLTHVVEQLGGFVWSDAGGFTLAWLLPEPFPITTAADAERWGTFYFAVRRELSTKFKVTIEADGGNFDTLFPAPTSEPHVGSRYDVPALTLVPFPPKTSAAPPAPKEPPESAAMRVAQTDDLLKTITCAAYDRGSKLTERDAATLLSDCSGPMPATVAWTQYEGGKHDTRDGAARSEPFTALGSMLTEYAGRIAAKGAGRYFIGAESCNGRCRDADIVAITLLSFDCDGRGEWDHLRAVLEEARLAFVAQRSSSHTPAVPKWHLTIALARPWSGHKPSWRAIWRFLTGLFAGIAGLTFLPDEKCFGFDHTTDRLGQPIFASARRTKDQSPPETITMAGRALDLDELLAQGGFDPAWYEARTAYEPREAATVAPHEGLLALVFAGLGMLGQRIERDSVRGYAVECPNERLHSTGQRFDGSTMIVDPSGPSGKGYFICLHAHCGKQKPESVLKLLPLEAVESARAEHAAAKKSRSRRPADAAQANGESLPTIRLGLDTERVVREAVDALARAENTYSRGGILARVVYDTSDKRVARDAGAPTIRHHTPSTLTCELSTLVRFERWDKDEEWVPCGPSPVILSALLERGIYPEMRTLMGLASAPILRADGTVAQSPGYDEASAHLLAFDASLAVAIAEQPTREAAIAGRDLLLDVVSQFPWRELADKSAWLALVLTLLGRAAIDGPCPMWIGTGNVRGCGKSRLMDVASIITTGREASRATQPDDDAEARKLITSIVVAGDEFLLLDNVDRPLGGSKLDALLTGNRWKDRLLGGNTTIDLPIRVVMAATGNNVLPIGDTIRRVLPVRLDSPEERPEQLTGWRYPDLLGHVRRERYRLVAAALTILRAWYVAGSPRAKDVRTWGSYEAWGAIIPHVLRWVDLPDPQETREGLEEDDPHHRALCVVVEKWLPFVVACGFSEQRGMSIHEATEKLYDTLFLMEATIKTSTDELRDALETLAPGRGKGSAKVDARNLGHVFRRAKGRMIGGRRLVQAENPDRHADVQRWTVAAAKAGASTASGSAGGQREALLAKIEFILAELGDPALAAEVHTYIREHPEQLAAACERLVLRYREAQRRT